MSYEIDIFLSEFNLLSYPWSSYAEPVSPKQSQGIRFRWEWLNLDTRLGLSYVISILKQEMKYLLRHSLSWLCQETVDCIFFFLVLFKNEKTLFILTISVLKYGEGPADTGVFPVTIHFLHILYHASFQILRNESFWYVAALIFNFPETNQVF